MGEDPQHLQIRSPNSCKPQGCFSSNWAVLPFLFLSELSHFLKQHSTWLVNIFEHKKLFQLFCFSSFKKHTFMTCCCCNRRLWKEQKKALVNLTPSRRGGAFEPSTPGSLCNKVKKWWGSTGKQARIVQPCLLAEENVLTFSVTSIRVMASKYFCTCKQVLLH